jgi:integrase
MSRTFSIANSGIAIRFVGIEYDFCVKNPARSKSIKIIKKPTPKKKTSYTFNEVRTILEFAKTDELFGIAMYIMLNTGIRGQEMRALTVDKFNFDKDFVLIDEAVKKTGLLGLPKNNEPRYVPLEPEVSEILRSMLQGKSGYITEKQNRYISERMFRDRYDAFFVRLNAFLEESGKKPIDGRTPHGTRHTFCTLRQKRGMPDAILMRITGHRTRVMLDVYTDMSDIADLSDAVKKHRLFDPVA